MGDAFDRVAGRIDGYGEEAVALQTGLVAIPALSPDSDGDGEADKMTHLKPILAQIGFDEIVEYNAPDDRVSAGFRPNLAARIHGRDRTRTVWIMSHIDVVPPGDLGLWTKCSPYEVVVDGDRIYGRGVEDNHQGLVASLLTVKALREEGIVPAVDVGLLIVADEETGSHYGLDYVVREHDIFGAQDIIVVPDGGLPDGTMIEVAEKSLVWLHFTTLGKQCHGSTPELGVNAHRAAANLVVRLDELYRIFPGTDDLFMPPGSTFEPTKKELNVPNINTIPGEDHVYFDCRVLPDVDLDRFMAEVDRISKSVEADFGVTIKLETPQCAAAAPPTAPDAPVVKALREAIREVYGVEARPMGIGGGTVAAVIRRTGLPAAVWAKIDDMAHQPDEYCSLTNLLGDAKVFAHLCLSS